MFTAFADNDLPSTEVYNDYQAVHVEKLILILICMPLTRRQKLI